MPVPHSRPVSRRYFIGTTAAAAAALQLMGSRSRLRADSSGEFRFAQIGCGGKGTSDLENTVKAGGKLVAMCDVDATRGAAMFKKYPDVPKFTDFRKMLDKMGNEIDGVCVSTPDHMHAAAAIDAIRRGKHVYVQKPLARTFEECQVLLEASRKHGVVTQMGNQGHAGAGLLLWQKMMDDNAFGEVQRIHTWSDRPIWPQGMTEVPTPDTPPADLDWDAWLGPQAMRPYSKRYLPFSWRGWWDFGCGAMGDMACHNMDPAFWIFKLGLPTSVKAQVSAPVTIAYPAWSIIDFNFAPSALNPKGLTLTWYDGKKLPTLPEGTHPQLKPGGNGCLVIGSKLSAMGGSHASPPTPIALTGQPFGDATKEAEVHWRGELKQLHGTDHHGQWVKACLAHDPKQTGSKFEYAAPMTQSILLGCIALRFPDQELKFDAEKKQITNHSEANAWLTAKRREGYDLSF